MKKIFLIALAASVVFCLPLTAQAKADFEMGGYIRVDMMWNSQNAMSHALTSYCARNNFLNNNHGRFLMNAAATRFNFTIKGPELWGGKVTGFIEVDFDGQPVTQPANLNDSSFSQAKLRLRHAMFKIVWPYQEVLFGQFWSVNSELIPETADSGGYAVYGATQLRLAQARYTYNFTDAFNASLAICDPATGRWGINVDGSGFAPNEGQTSETPMVEAKLRFEQDFYGKAAWYGKPRGFYIGAGAGYFRSRNIAADGAANTWQTWGTNNFQNINRIVTTAHRYHDHWLFLIENFTPIIPTVSKSLAGSLGLAHQWWIGQGVSAWRLAYPTFDRYYTFFGRTNNVAGAANALGYNLNFIKMYGGWAQLQYYWTEEIYTNINAGFSKAFNGITQERDGFLANILGATQGFVYGTPGFDPVKSTWRIGVTQWWRPVPAVKFAVQYTYMQTNYFQYRTDRTELSNKGSNHSVMANAWYLF